RQLRVPAYPGVEADQDATGKFHRGLGDHRQGSRPRGRQPPAGIGVTAWNTELPLPAESADRLLTPAPRRSPCTKRCLNPYTLSRPRWCQRPSTTAHDGGNPCPASPSSPRLAST